MTKTKDIISFKRNNSNTQIFFNDLLHIQIPLHTDTIIHTWIDENTLKIDNVHKNNFTYFIEITSPISGAKLLKAEYINRENWEQIIKILQNTHEK